MKLLPLVDRYVEFRQSMGAVFRSQSYFLRRFARSVGPHRQASRIRPEQVREFLLKYDPSTRARLVDYSTLNVFFRYAIARGHLQSNPLPTNPPGPRSRFVPYIYSRDELRRLVGAANCHLKTEYKVNSAAARTILLLLYGTGLRVSEAIALNRSDVDVDQRLMTIRRTKFFKERMVPLGPRIADSLRTYAKNVPQSKVSDQGDLPFLQSSNGCRLRLATVQKAFGRIRQAANVRREDGCRFQPRLHDLRHTFAVHCLTKWYEDGSDVQRLLPILSTYLGHRHLSGTMFYLSMTPDLLRHASERFECCFPEQDAEDGEDS